MQVVRRESNSNCKRKKVRYTYVKLTLDSSLAVSISPKRASFSSPYNTILFLFVLATELVRPQGSSLHANTTCKYTQKGNMNGTR